MTKRHFISTIFFWIRTRGVSPKEPIENPDGCEDSQRAKAQVFAGLGMMAVTCPNLIPQHYGKDVDIVQIPHDDRQRPASLRLADTHCLMRFDEIRDGLHSAFIVGF